MALFDLFRSRPPTIRKGSAPGFTSDSPYRSRGAKHQRSKSIDIGSIDRAGVNFTHDVFLTPRSPVGAMTLPVPNIVIWDSDNPSRPVRRFVIVSEPSSPCSPDEADEEEVENYGGDESDSPTFFSKVERTRPSRRASGVNTACRGA